MSKEINLTSPEWINMVFEGKNQKYGAYTLRQDSGNRHLWSFIAVTGFVVFALSIPRLTNFLGFAKEHEEHKDLYQIVDINLGEQKVDDANKIVKQFKEEQEVSLKPTIKFTIPKIESDENVKPEEDMESQSTLNESVKAISVANVESNNPNGTDIADLENHQLIVNSKEPEKIWETVEQNPSFPGGETELMDYLSSHIRYPAIAIESDIQGKVIVQFVVFKDGSIKDVKVLRGVDRSIDNEAVRVVQSMPDWIPGKQSGNPVNVKFTLPVTFRLQ